MAGVREYRLALIVAIAGSLVLVLLLVAPTWFLTEQTVSDSKADQPKTTAYSLPVRPVQAPSVDMKTNRMPAPHTTEKQPVTRTKKTPSSKIAPSHQPAPSTDRHMKGGNELKHGYYVQAGAFKDTARAKKLANSLQHAGWHVQVIPKDHALHAVLVGPWPTRNQAQNNKLQLARKNKIKGFIIQQ